MRIEPSWRTGVGMALILLLIVGWSVLAVTGAAWVSGLPALVQALYYLLAGIAWILPLRPLIRWMSRRD
ncbi:hypothetical protein GCM10023232_07010 [Sphingosinicella ginsenosidimutans]|uniref:DUF2842 domain-containing protein n=1 Tax=Allosphingosinicella ginsenosidimutans TaxID=1176539 RepID=A0A5C6TVM9_9SPHN|nr:DUF2842 domain-containing protein [Sphingosinicella ginsenosidimutans]TXC64533.1 DUF2842 domain-containing protein [Sphingosinicella ginsenosidimutans]